MVSAAVVLNCRDRFLGNLDHTFNIPIENTVNVKRVLGQVVMYMNKFFPFHFSCITFYISFQVLNLSLAKI